MASIKISALNAAATIDGTNDYFPIVTASLNATQRINRATFLGVSGIPADISTAQSFTNKTFNNSNTMTLRDDRFTLQDDSDATKQARFQLSGITTGTTRSYTLPNANVTLASLTGIETLTNKTLTSPVITGGSIDNTTISVDFITGHTTTTVVNVAGVQMSNGIIGNSNAVVTSSIADSAVTPAKLQTGTGTGWSWLANSPTLVNFNIGTGGVAINSARFNQTGKTVRMHGKANLGSSGASVTGAIVITLPVTSVAVPIGVGPIGMATLIQSGVNQFPAWIYWRSTTTVSLQPINVAGTYATTTGDTSASVPFTWASGDGLEYDLCYEAA